MGIVHALKIKTNRHARLYRLKSLLDHANHGLTEAIFGTSVLVCNMKSRDSA